MKKILMIIVLISIPLVVIAKSSNTQPKDFANVILFAYFGGEKEGEAQEYFSNNRDKILKLYDGLQGRSLTNYLKTISYDKFNLKNIFPQDDGSKIKAYKITNVSESDAYKQNVDESIIEEIIRSNPSLNNQVIDYDNDGYIDNLTIILYGGTEGTGSNKTFVNHKNDYAGSLKYGNKYIGNYNMLNTANAIESEFAGSGVIAHEFLHSLGYPDLYSKQSDYYPVQSWDIMASANYRMTYPLAYERYVISKWIDIDTITESGTFTLDNQSNKDGNQAYIIKSPINDEELFVVEYRKKGDVGDENSLDSAVFGSGIIIYRVNTRVEGLSNYLGKTAIYVFRPNNETYPVNAYLSKESSRTSFGNNNLNETENAITFSDGTNSGIVISEVGSALKDTITFKVTMPNSDVLDLWSDTSFEGQTGFLYKPMDSIYYNDYLYTVHIKNNKLYTNKYKESWSVVGSNIDVPANISNCFLETINNQLYLIMYSDSGLYIYKFNGSSWISVLNKTASFGNISTYSFNNIIYINARIDHFSNNYQDAILFKFDGTSLTEVAKYINKKSGILLGSPKLANIGSDMYAIINNDAEKNYYIYKCNTTCVKVNSSNIAYSSSYDVITKDNKLYFLLARQVANGLNNFKVYTYDGTFKEILTNGNILEQEPKSIVLNNNIYFITSESTGMGITKMYMLDEMNNIKQVGLNVDNGMDDVNVNLATSDNTIYVMGKKNNDTNNIVVKKKVITSVPLESISLNKGDFELIKGNSTRLNVLYNPSNTTDNKVVTWTSNNPNIVSVDKTGLVKAIKSGIAIITAKVGTKSVSIKITVKDIPISSVKLNVGSLNLELIKSYNLKATIYPTNTTLSKTLTWTSSNPKVASVDKYGKIIANNLGTTYITIKTSNGKTYSTKVNVTKVNPGSVTNVYINDQVYNGKVKKPKLILKYAGMTLSLNKDYTYSYINNKKVGTATIKVIFKGNIFSGTKNIYFNIVPKKVSIKRPSTKKGTLIAKWNKTTGANKYEVTLKDNLTNKWYTFIVGNKSSYTIKNLASKRNYTVRIRAIKYINGKYLYGPTSNTKTIKVK